MQKKSGPPTLHINGQPIDLSHLAPLERRVELELRGDLKKTVLVKFHFSCHCYSRRLRENETAPEGQAVPDGSIHKPRPRVFDPERYQLSLALPGLIDALISANDLVTKSRQENFYRVESVGTERNGTPVQLPYFIFMHARKMAEPNRPKHLRVFVESAYPEQAGIPHPRGEGSRSLGRMLGETWA
jgi:hypothetical protein